MSDNLYVKMMTNWKPRQSVHLIRVKQSMKVKTSDRQRNASGLILNYTLFSLLQMVDLTVIPF
jgi:hypothetical protein